MTEIQVKFSQVQIYHTEIFPFKTSIPLHEPIHQLNRCWKKPVKK